MNVVGLYGRPMRLPLPLLLLPPLLLLLLLPLLLLLLRLLLLLLTLMKLPLESGAERSRAEQSRPKRSRAEKGSGERSRIEQSTWPTAVIKYILMCQSPSFDRESAARIRRCQNAVGSGLVLHTDYSGMGCPETMLQIMSVGF